MSSAEAKPDLVLAVMNLGTESAAKKGKVLIRGSKPLAAAGTMPALDFKVISKENLEKLAVMTFPSVHVDVAGVSALMDKPVMSDELSEIIEKDMEFGGLQVELLQLIFTKLAELGHAEAQTDLVKLLTFLFKRGTLIQERGVLRAATESDSREIVRLIITYRIQDRIEEGGSIETLTLGRLPWMYPKIAAMVREKVADKTCPSIPLEYLPLLYRFPAASKLGISKKYQVPFLVWSLCFHFVINRKKAGDIHRDTKENRRRVLMELAKRYSQDLTASAVGKLANEDFSVLDKNDRNYAKLKKKSEEEEEEEGEKPGKKKS